MPTPSHLLLLLPHGLEVLVLLRLLLRLLDEEPDGFAVQHFLHVEDLVEILLQLLPPHLDVFGAFVGDSEYLLLGEGRQILYFAF